MLQNSASGAHPPSQQGCPDAPQLGPASASLPASTSSPEPRDGSSTAFVAQAYPNSVATAATTMLRILVLKLSLVRAKSFGVHHPEVVGGVELVQRQSLDLAIGELCVPSHRSLVRGELAA